MLAVAITEVETKAAWVMAETEWTVAEWMATVEACILEEMAWALVRMV